MAFPADTTPIPDSPTTGYLGATSPTLPELAQALVDGVNAVTAELGANPSGPEADVAARFTAVESDVTTLAGTVAALPGGDVNIFDAVTYGAAIDGATDDTAAWQAAINAAAAAGGGIVTSSIAGVSVIAGALQDTGGANSQLLLPDVHLGDDPQAAVEIRGPWEQSACSSVVGAAVTPATGLVLKSTLASGTGAILGGYGSGTSYQHFTFLNLTLRNLTFRTVANPTITGVDLRHVNSCTLDGVIVDTGQYDTTLSEPTSSGSFGLRLPTLANGANVNLHKVSVFGFYNGIEHSEHASFDNVAVGGVKVAITATAANHASHYRRILLGYYEIGLKFTGEHYVDVQQWDCEHAASGWYTTDYDVSDASNYGKGLIRWASVLQGVGPHNSFTKSGGSGIATSRVGDALGSGGSTVYVYRDRLVAAAGNVTLTLGATPVANSPLVWVNGTIKWPTTDYTISGAVVTFNSGLSVSDVVAVQYQSTNGTYTAATLATPAVNIVDTFTRADSTTALGSTTTGSKAWTQNAGTWGITSNKAYVSAGIAGIVCRATVDAAVADGTVSVTVTDTLTGTNTAPGGLVVRSDASNNYYLCEVKVGTAYTPKIYKGVSGTNTAIATGASVTVAAGSVISVVLSGNTITVKDDGVPIVSVTDSSYSSNTRHGLYTQANAATVGSGRLDDFSVQP